MNMWYYSTERKQKFYSETFEWCSLMTEVKKKKNCQPPLLLLKKELP